MSTASSFFAVTAEPHPVTPVELTDQEREFLIRRSGRMVRLCMARYERTGCFSDRGLADYWRMTMEADIKARSPAQVARMRAASKARFVDYGASST